MFQDYVYEKSPAVYASHVWIKDIDGINQVIPYMEAFARHGFEIVEYKDDLSFRIEYEEKVKEGHGKMAVLQQEDSYVPYDILKCFNVYAVSLKELFPNLDEKILQEKSSLDLELLTQVVESNLGNIMEAAQTEAFFTTTVYNRNNLRAYFIDRLKSVLLELQGSVSYSDWYRIAEEKAQIDIYAVRYGLDIDTSPINALFQEYVLQSFGRLSTKIDKNTPVMVSRAMEYMSEQSNKFVVIVMDGMSEFDWGILAKSFGQITYQQSAMFAMIPSTTSISRQCLLSNKFPRQLLSPWNQAKEKTEFIQCARNLGYADNQIAYARGYDADFGSFIRCGAVIINDVDDMVHGQCQGRLGMYNDISVLAAEEKLRGLSERLLAKGFDVYITADHGNTLCTGKGKFVGAGVAVETKSHRMAVVKDFADKAGLMNKYGLIDYPKYYLPQEYDYLICDKDTSLDNPGEQVMTHGGMTIDEVIVPFIKIEAVLNNG